MFDTMLFYGALIAAGSILLLLSSGQWRLRALILIAASLFILARVIELAPELIALVGCASVWIFISGKLTVPIAKNRPYLASFIVIAPVLVLWVTGKQATALELEHYKILYFVGFSFFLIKAWTLSRDLHDGRIEDPSLLAILAYFFFFPTYVSGPMHYFKEFDSSLRSPEKLDLEAVIDSVFRILLGLVKVKVLAALFTPISLVMLKDSGDVGLRTLIFGSFAYSFVIWFDFSGYSDMAIGTARLLGIKTPENFNNPYMAPNIREFWQRWHISFSRVLTGYLFVPISRRLQKNMPEKRKTIMIVSYLATFLFCGYWHGPTWNFIIWGLYHGAGLIVYDLYRPTAAKRRLKRKGKPEPRIVASAKTAGAVAFNFTFVSMGWIFFALPIETLFGG